MKNIDASYRLTEHGATLIFSLVILLVLTIVGLTAMQNSTLQEKIAGNLRDKEFSFQVAETVLREAEDWVESQDSRTEPDDNCTVDDNTPECFVFILGSHDPVGGWPNDARQTVQTFQDISETPEFFTEEVEMIGDVFVEDRDTLTLGHGTSEGSDIEKTRYRVTSRSVGGTTSTVSKVQTFYIRRF